MAVARVGLELRNMALCHCPKNGSSRSRDAFGNGAGAAHKGIVMVWDILSYAWLTFCILFFLVTVGAQIAHYIKRGDDDKK